MNALIERQAAAPMVFDEERLKVLTNTVAQGATPAELSMFVELCKATGLNPFKKEVWFIKGNSYTKKTGEKVEGRVQIMTGIEGFYRIANSHPAFDGIENEFGPFVDIPLSGGPVKSIKAPEYVESRVFRKDRSRPQVSRAFWREYAQELVTYGGQLSIWAKLPSVMLTKCADSMALRKAFPQELNGLYTAEEMPREFAQPKESHEPEKQAAASVEAEQRKNYLKQQAARLQSGEYHIEFGSKKGTPISKATNSVWLEKHLAAHDAELSPEAKEAITTRIADLKRDYARKQDAASKADVVDAEVVETFDDGWTPSPEELEEIRKAEQEAE